MILTKLNICIAWLFIFWFYGCNPTEKPASEQLLYFDLDTLLKSNIEYLNNKNPLIVKMTTSNNVKEQKKLRNINWAKELSSFKNIDINKPIFKNEFNISTINTGNGKTIRYERLKGSHTSIRFLEVGYYNDTIFSVNGQILKENPVFYSSTNYELIFDKNKKDMLSRYRIYGTQHFIFLKANTFSIEGFIK